MSNADLVTFFSLAFCVVRTMTPGPKSVKFKALGDLGKRMRCYICLSCGCGNGTKQTDRN